MSFMFNPYPFDDLRPLNDPGCSVEDGEVLLEGNQGVASFVAEDACALIGDGASCIIGIDGFATASFDVLVNRVARTLTERGVPVRTIKTSSLFKDSDELDALFAPFLPQDREVDPPLLFGKIFSGSAESFFSQKKLEEIDLELKATDQGTVVIVYGNFSSIESLRRFFDRLYYVDVIPKNAVLRYKSGREVNIGDNVPRTYTEIMRRAYYCDFEVSVEQRTELLQQQLFDHYIIGNDDENWQLMSRSLLERCCKAQVERPFRCKPVYNEGVWGGYYCKKYRGLPEEMRNCAWLFDLIPAEVSMLMKIGNTTIDIPFYTFIRLQSGKLLGEKSVKKFGEYFPIRFNYDDTMHSGGHMSIQVHPGEAFAKEKFNELGRQDESYYIVDTGLGAKTYCGFKESADSDQFFEEIVASEKTGKLVDYESFVNGIPTKPGMQFMLPAGTIHSSGRNQLVLEIGSLTIGSYTFKLYDYVRKDLNGTSRPIHSKYGKEVLRTERRTDWVEKNLLMEPRLTASGRDWEEFVIGQNELMYFSTYRLEGITSIPQQTGDSFHVLCLVDGERAMVRGETDPSACFEMNYLDIVVVPAGMGKYRIENLGNQPIAIHKTMLN
jgi:mannose-6-phosphate isomerase